jgi:hypothetical protein
MELVTPMVLIIAEQKSEVPFDLVVKAVPHQPVTFYSPELGLTEISSGSFSPS